MGLFDMFKKKDEHKTLTKCAECFRPLVGPVYSLDNKKYCKKCYNRKMAIIQQTEGQGNCANPQTGCQQTQSHQIDNTDNATELYLELRGKYPKVTIDFTIKVLECRKLDIRNSEIKLIGFNKDTILLAIHKSSGIPYVIDCLDSVSGKNMGFKVSYTEVIALMSEENKHTYSNLNEETWYEYTVMRVGDLIPIYYDRSGTGPYHEETRLGICMTDNGFVIDYDEISPMGGSFSRHSIYPFGSFKNKSLPEVEEILRQHAVYIDPQKIKIKTADYERLIRTDEYKAK